MLHSSERGRIPGYRLGANTMKLIWLSAIALGLSACCTHPQNSAPSDQAPKAKAAKPDAQAMAAGHAKAKPMPASKIAGVSATALAKAIQTAIDRLPGGEALAAEIEIENGKAVIDVKVFANGKLYEVEINGATGKIQEVEDEDDDDEDDDDGDGDDD